MTPFVQLNQQDCKYLLELIDEMDSLCEFTRKQRSHTRPKIERIRKDPKNGRLAYQDTEYLLELIEDDELAESREQRESTTNTLKAIRDLQCARFQSIQDIEDQRTARRNRRVEKISKKE